MTFQLLAWMHAACWNLNVNVKLLRNDRNEDGMANPLTSSSDHYINSPYNLKTLSSRQVMRIKKIIN